jgi:hypothetical protein
MSVEEDNVKELSQLMGSADDDFTLTDLKEDILSKPGKYDVRYISTGLYDDEGKEKRIKLVLRDPRNPALAGALFMSMDSQEAFADACKAVIVEPKILVEEVPLQDDEGNYLDEGNEKVDSVKEAKKVPGILMARSSIQNEVRICVMETVGVTPGFLEGYMKLFLRPTTTPQAKSSTPSPKSTESGPPSDSEPSQEKKDSTKNSSEAPSSPVSSTSEGATQSNSKTSEKPFPVTTTRTTTTNR